MSSKEEIHKLKIIASHLDYITTKMKVRNEADVHIIKFLLKEMADCNNKLAMSLSEGDL